MNTISVRNIIKGVMIGSLLLTICTFASAEENGCTLDQRMEFHKSFANTENVSLEEIQEFIDSMCGPSLSNTQSVTKTKVTKCINEKCETTETTENYIGSKLSDSHTSKFEEESFDLFKWFFGFLGGFFITMILLNIAIIVGIVLFFVWIIKLFIGRKKTKEEGTK